METFKTLPDAIALAEFAHRNQVDHAGFPYIEHPKRVLAGVQAQGGRPFVQIAAILHDVTEDTAFTTQMLLDLGFSPAAVNLVELLDKNSQKDWHGKIHLDDYYAKIRENPDALMIKKADISDNMLEWRRSYLPQERQDRLAAKYRKALDALGVS